MILLGHKQLNRLLLSGMGKIKMENTSNIMDMLDWNMPCEVQLEGRKLAKSIEDVCPFLQPMSPNYNKNVWENCAIILSERGDDELRPYLSSLFEWLQDMNWPGAHCIFKRMQIYSNNTSFNTALFDSIKKAQSNSDKIWENNLNMLIRKD